jgi:hypothetical protein
MSVIWVGDQSFKTKLIEDISWEVVFDRWGVASATEAYWVDWNAASNLVKAKTVHSVYDYLIRDTATIRREEANLARVTINYKGIPPTTNERFWRITSNVESQSILTHPEIEVLLADPLNKPIIDDENAFQGWASDSPLAGYDNWQVPTFTLEEVWTRGSAVAGNEDLENTGLIDVPPSADGLRPSVGDRNWLMMGGSEEAVGEGTKLVRKWKISGLAPYPEAIYTI